MGKASVPTRTTPVNADGVMPIFANGPQTQRMMLAIA